MPELIVMILALLGVGGAVWLRGRAAGKASVPAPSVVRAEVRDEVFVERRTERGDALARDLATIHANTRSKVEARKVSREDASKMMGEIKAWDDGSEF